MVDMFFYRDPEEVERQQQEEAAAKIAALGAALGELATCHSLTDAVGRASWYKHHENIAPI